MRKDLDIDLKVIDGKEGKERVIVQTTRRMTASGSQTSHLNKIFERRQTSLVSKMKSVSLPCGHYSDSHSHIKNDHYAGPSKAMKYNDVARQQEFQTTHELQSRQEQSPKPILPHPKITTPQLKPQWKPP
jgi:hypothetical protein